MASGRDKNGSLLAEGDIVDVRGRVTQIDRLTGDIYIRVGATNLALGIPGTENPTPDPSNILRLKLGDVLKVP